jgi:uncharacterized protein (DUF302 family)
MKQTLFAAVAAAALITAGCEMNDLDRPVINPDVADQPAAQAIVAEQSASSFETTVSNLRAALESRPLTVFATVDHSQGASDAGMQLTSSTLFIFGNPKSGTPLMQANPVLGLELPMKVLVVETENGVQIIRQDVSAILRQYGVNPADVNASKIEQTLQTIVSEAAR